ncbi:hypothetical protein GHT06_007042 [Daphnia sinensis]|uniref:Uncharacterized protein n=1 Tax=Daphnia sinensis TaxID=1820382 RepID=A0AAD5KE88_9CRUS|nr:hypothetical protein GHT06_007042 [Daphnia sinensis]
MDFEANAKEGIAVDWPIRYKDLEKWYGYVERFAGISGSKDGLAQLPDGDFLPPMEMNVVEKVVAARIKEQYKGNRHMLIGRVANLTEALPVAQIVNTAINVGWDALLEDILALNLQHFLQQWQQETLLFAIFYRYKNFIR